MIQENKLKWKKFLEKKYFPKFKQTTKGGEKFLSVKRKLLDNLKKSIIESQFNESIKINVRTFV